MSAPIEIVPALMPKTRVELEKLVARLKPFSSAFQLDVMDGRFVEQMSYPFSREGTLDDDALPGAGAIFYELDLMIEKPAEYADKLLSVGARRLIFHVESDMEEGIRRALALAKAAGKEAWVAISNDTPLSALDPFMSEADGVQLMGIDHIGSQGQPFDPRVLERLETMRALHPSLPRSVDGAVSIETIERLVTSGATRLVAGSAILEAEDPKQAIESLRALI